MHSDAFGFTISNEINMNKKCRQRQKKMKDVTSLCIVFDL